MNDSLTYVIFGASGDLTKRKLIPALYALFVQKLIPEKFVLLGLSRTVMSDEDFRREMKADILEYKEIDDVTGIDEFTTKLFYSPIQFDDVSTYKTLEIQLASLRHLFDLNGNTVYYLSTPPSLYAKIPQNLAAVGLHEQQNGWKRLIIEKPFGYDLESAVNLKDSLLENWKEEQIFRIDHYLGKETVQNLLVTRFSNGMFEPLWNRNYIHHVEITSAESIGVEKRGGYYERSGALRDMVQNHLLQVTALTAMEPPSSLDSGAIRNEILKVLQSLRPIRRDEVQHVAVRGQYLSSTIKGQTIAGYRDEPGVAPDSMTETFVALKFYIDNWRWGGVPFYIRTGKRLPTRVTEIVIHFKPTPHFLFSGDKHHESCNQLVIRIQPDEGILLKFAMKTPGAGFGVQNVNMDFHYDDLSNPRIPSAYERLIFDSINGDSTLFARTEEVLEAWKFFAPVIDVWKNGKEVPLFGYPAGSWGPDKTDDLIEDKNITWRYPCKNLSDDGIFCNL